ncbi:armadillo-type protein [Sporodiniella umbellata]|nr:armadillo-type protein [Sporodiniella umbellata]
MKDNSVPLELNTGQGENRFKYQSFKSRVDRIKVDVVRRSKLVDDEPDHHGSFFYEALQSWKDLNMTKHFKSFYKEMSPLVKSLPSIIYHKEKIVEILERHLQVKESMAYDGLLDLVTKLAKDLESDFYPYYPRLLSSVLPLVYHRDIKLLESVFNCIAYLFKFLSRQILPELDKTFSLLSKLLGEDTQGKPYVRKFTAEAFAFLLRKMRGAELTKITEYMLGSLAQAPSNEYEEGLAMLFFEAIKQIDHRIHSRGEAIYKELLAQTYRINVNPDELSTNPIHKLLTKTTLLIQHHTLRQHFTPIIHIVIKEAQQNTSNQTILAIHLSLLNMFVTVRKASRVEDFKPVFSLLQELSKTIFTSSEQYPTYIYTECLRTITGALYNGPLEVTVSGGRVILEAVSNCSQVELVYGFYLSLAKLEWGSFTQIALPYVIKYTSSRFDTNSQETILFLSEISYTNAIQANNSSLSSSFTTSGLLRFPSEKKSLPLGLLEKLKQKLDWKKERDILNATDPASCSDDNISAVTILASILHILPSIEVSVDKAAPLLFSLLDSLRTFLEKSKDNTMIDAPFVLAHKNFALESLLGLTLSTLAGFAHKHKKILPDLVSRHQELIKVLLAYSKNESVLSGVYDYLELLRPTDQSKFSLEDLKPVYNILKYNFSSYKHFCRLNSFKIIALFDQPPLKQDEHHKTDEPCEIASMASEIESIEASFKDYREKVKLMQKLNLLLSSSRVPDLYADFIPRLALGILTVNLRPLWEDAKKILTTLAQINSTMYWDLLYAELVKFDNEKELIWDGVSKNTISELTEKDSEPEDTGSTKIGKISFDCPTFTKFTHIEDKNWSVMKDKKAQSLALLFAKFCLQERGHVDFWNYYTLILSVLKETNIITESKGRYLVIMFMDFFNSEFLHITQEDEDEEEQKETAHGIEVLPRTSRLTKTKMASWLSLFSVFTNTKSAYKSQELYDIFLHIVTMGDAKLQLAALECVFTWKDTGIKPYADNLRNLMDDIKFRDELSTLVQSEESATIDPAHRSALMPVIMRVLFGRLVQKSKTSNKINKSSRRKAILGAIACCKENEIRCFIDLALEPFQVVVKAPSKAQKLDFDQQSGLALEHIAWRKQIGFLNLLEDVIKQLASHILPFLSDLLKVVLYIIHFARGHTEDDMEIDQGTVFQSSKSKEVKNTAIKRIVEMFKISGYFNFEPYVPAMFEAFITPRIKTLPMDSTHDLSPLVTLFAVWSKKTEHAHFLTDFNSDVLPQIIATLGAKSLGPTVQHTLLETIESILDLCDDEMDTDDNKSLRQKTIVTHVDILLKSLQYRLINDKSDPKFSHTKHAVREISIAARIASYTQDGVQAATIIQLLLPNLKKPSRSIPERSKQDIYTIWSKLIRIVPEFEVDSYIYREYYSIAANMFATAYSRESRTGLVQVFHALSEINPRLTQVDQLLTKMNAYMAKRIDEQDIDSVLEALNTLAEEYKTLDSVQWLPILHQLTHCMQHPEELSIRGTATHCMTLFLDSVVEQVDPEEKQKLVEHVQHVIYPGIKRGLRSRTEAVRSEFVALLNACIKSLPELPMFEDLVQIAGDDEETNFFTTVYHIQVHRRSRALLRLAEKAQQSTFKVSTINNIFIPIITAFFNERDRVVDNGLLQQCTLTLSALAKLLPWNHYHRLLQNYLKLVKTDEEKEKLHVRVIVGLLDSFHFDLKTLDLSDEEVQKVMGRQKVRIEYLTDEKIEQERKEAEDVEDLNEPVEVEEKEVKEGLEKVHSVLVEKVLPELNALLNVNNSRKSVLVRVPLALGIAKLLCHLPEKSKRVNLPGLLTSVCHIMRSRAQDIRDTTRETLIKLSAFLGPSYFNFFITELKTALTKGYELHVLGYTINSLLLDMVPRLNVGELDYCLPQLTGVLMNDIFSGIGDEKDADEMTGKTKEAKSRRSPAAFELIAKVIFFKNVGVLLVPLKNVMSETESSRTLRKVDDLLRRISHGLVNNPKFESMELLDFTYGLVSENLDDYKTVAKTKIVKTQKELNFEVQVKRPTGEVVDYYRANAYRFVYFGLNLFSTALKKIPYDLSESEVSDRFKKLVNIVGNTLYTKQSANVVLAARIMSKLIVMPIPNIESAVDVSIDRSFSLIKSSGGTQTDTVQSCLKLLTVCIRDTKRSSLSEAQLTYILNFVRPDMEEVERQGTIFALVRAIISRKFVAPEMYDLMDTVSNIMVTNHSKEIREQARSVYFMFLMDYPQGKGRLKKQVSFVIKNLEFEFETGRESIMELLHHVITKFSVEIYAEFVDATFLALVMRLINDDSPKCREMSAALIKSLLSRHPDKLPTIYKLLNTWLDSAQKPSLQRVACQVYSILLDTFGAQVRGQATDLTIRLVSILNASKEKAEVLAESHSDDEDDDEDSMMEIDIEWEVTYYAMNTFAKLIKVFPKIVYDQESQKVWPTIQYMLLYPHSWVRTSATRLFGAYFSGIDAQTRIITTLDTPCVYLDKQTLRDLATEFLEQLRSKHITQDHADQIVKNLFFIGKSFYFMSEQEDAYGMEAGSVAIDDAHDEAIEDEDEDAQVAAEQIKKEAQKKTLNWLFRKCSFDARGAAIKKLPGSIMMVSDRVCCLK